MKATPCPPHLDREQALWTRGSVRIAGVDEVGRGCLSGPVVAAAVVLPVECRPIPGVRDSKLLPPAERERLCGLIREQAIAVGIGAACVAEIDRINILRATHLAMARALLRVHPVDHALVDGSPVRGTDLGEHTTIVGGDGISYTIACASIVAKVVRDRFMHRLAERHPEYGWQTNVGYGSRQHIEAMRTMGVTIWHRRTFSPVREIVRSGVQTVR